MKRLAALCLLAAAAVFPPALATAAPPDLATSCAALFMPKVRGLATASGVVYPIQWYRMSITRTQVTLDVVINLPSGAVRYSGFKCEQQADGIIVAVASPI